MLDELWKQISLALFLEGILKHQLFNQQTGVHVFS
jgi:hypothetical protein